MSDRDMDIEDEVLRRLHANLSLPAGKVAVRVVDGCVILSGCLELDFQKNAAEHGIWEIEGVTSLLNLITIEPTRNDGTTLEDKDLF